MFDLVVGKATIVDGSGAPGYSADIGIRDGKIKAIGEINDDNAEYIDASGLVCAPGFIDMHSHNDLAFFKTPPPDAKIRQGITTELVGQDGLGAAPVNDSNRPELASLLAGLNGELEERKWQWRSYCEYLDALHRQPLATNAASLISHGPVRMAAMGMAERDALPEELALMKSLVQEAMAAGAFGFSTGLIYPPCSYASTEELIEINREVAALDGIFVVHQRDEGYYLAHSFDEVVSISRESGARLHISHLQAYGPVNWPLMEKVLSEADAFLESGGSVTWDRYPYLAGSTVLTAVLPAWTLNEGPLALVENLTNPDYRARIHREFEKGLDVWHNRQISVGWDNIIISAVRLDHNQWMEGNSCQEVADQKGKNPIDMVCDLLAEEKLAVTMISFYGSDAIMDRVLTHKQATVCSDGIYGGRPHPRLYGTYPRFIKSFVRDKGLLSLEGAIWKISAFPAQILGIKDRGRIEQGLCADLVVFDPETIADTADYDNPQAHPIGIHYVMVNGRPVIYNDVLTGEFPGRVIKRR